MCKKNFRIQMTGRYLILPVWKNTEERVLRIFADGREITEFMAPSGDVPEGITAPDFESPLNLSEYAGQTLELRGDMSDAFYAGVRVSDELPAPAANRPLLHWSPEVAWGNDPNGLVYHDGIYEFYYQYNPVNTHWMNMSWAHTRGTDLLHWERSETVMLPDPEGTVYSGYAMVNEGGYFGLPEDALLYFYTQAGNNPHPWDTGKPFHQKLAYSIDGGRTIVRTDRILIPDPLGDTKDPRDPSIHRYEKGGFWYIVLYYGHYISAIWKSEDLEHWTELQKLDLRKYGMRECSDMFPVKREDGSEVWVFWTADGYYLMGEFDGQEFRHDGIRHEAYADSIGYAAQCWRGVGDELITVTWLRTFSEGQNYRSIYSIPRKIGVSVAENGERLHFRMIPQFEEQRQLMREELNPSLRWMAPEDAVLDLEMKALEPCDITWEFPGAKLTYEQQAGRFLIDGECKHYRRYYPGNEQSPESGAFEVKIPAGLTDFSLIWDRGILEIAADDDSWVYYLEMPAERFGGEVVMRASARVKTCIYQIR